MAGARGRRIATRLSPDVGYVVPVGVGLVVLHLALRAWLLFPAWFFLDDFNLLDQADRPAPTWGYLTESYNGHLMPGGRLLVWVVVWLGPANWTLAASLTFLLQALAAASCLWMLVTVFGRRWGILAPLALFLSTALAVPSYIWWAAALTLVPMQAAFFLAVGSWVAYLRSSRPRWLVATVAAVAFGLFFWVKSLLVVAVLAYLVLGWFGRGHGWRRVTGLVRDYRLAALALGMLSGAYALFYVTSTTQLPGSRTGGSLGALAETMLGTSFGVGAVGGPWRWDNVAPPTAYADPPSWLVSVAWAGIATGILLTWLRRSGTLKAWALLGSYLLVLLALLHSSRGEEFGSTIGLELRYLADAALVLTLVVGLATMEVPGAVGSSRAREAPLLARPVPPVVIIGATVVVAVGGVASSLIYGSYWHHDNAGEKFLKTVQRDLDTHGRVHLASQIVPEDVMSHLAAPSNSTEFLVPLVSDKATFPRSSSRLAVTEEDGTIRRALIGQGARSRPGPVADCGWRVRSAGLSIPLANRAFDWEWWIRIGYLYSQDSPVTVSTGDDSITTSLEPGVNSLYVRLKGSFDEVRIEGIAPGTTLCVDTVEVGQVEPGGPL